MSGEYLLLIQFESIHTREGLYLIVHRLTGQPLAVRGRSHGWHRMHVRFGDIFDINGNIPLPDTDRLVISRRNKSSIVVNKSNGINGSQMAVVFLNYTSRASVPTNDLLIGHTGEEEVGAFLIGIEFYRISDLSIGEPFDALTRLCVP